MTETIEDSVENFIDIESDLQQLAKPGVATPAVSGAESGSVVGAERVPSDSVPEGYPVPIDGDGALALEVRIDVDTSAIVFLNWPDDGTSFDQIEQLLSETGVAFDSFADLYGEEVPIAVRDGFVVAALRYGPDDTSRMPDRRGRTVDDEREVTATDVDAADDSAMNQVPFLTLLSLGMIWVHHEVVFGVGPTMGMGIWWVLIGFFLLGAVASDRAWVNATTDRELAKWWAVVVPLVPEVGAPLYLLQHYRARSVASLEQTE